MSDKCPFCMAEAVVFVSLPTHQFACGSLQISQDKVTQSVSCERIAHLKACLAKLGRAAENVIDSAEAEFVGSHFWVVRAESIENLKQALAELEGVEEK